MRLILASKSTARAKILKDAGLHFKTHSAMVDERSVERVMGKDISPEDRAQILAQTKALAVSEHHLDALVLGCDQILSLDDDVIHQVTDFEAARSILLKLSGKTHQLSSAIALAQNGTIVWSHASLAFMTMRQLDPGFIGRHLAFAGESVLNSVGCYHFEGHGIQLFEKIDGDYFTILGLPLLPLLKELRSRGVIDG